MSFSPEVESDGENGPLPLEDTAGASSVGDVVTLAAAGKDIPHLPSASPPLKVAFSDPERPIVEGGIVSPGLLGSTAEGAPSALLQESHIEAISGGGSGIKLYRTSSSAHVTEVDDPLTRDASPLGSNRTQTPVASPPPPMASLTPSLISELAEALGKLQAVVEAADANGSSERRQAQAPLSDSSRARMEAYAGRRSSSDYLEIVGKLRSVVLAAAATAPSEGGGATSGGGGGSEEDFSAVTTVSSQIVTLPMPPVVPRVASSGRLLSPPSPSSDMEPTPTSELDNQLLLPSGIGVLGGMSNTPQSPPSLSRASSVTTPQLAASSQILMLPMPPVVPRVASSGRLLSPPSPSSDMEPAPTSGLDVQPSLPSGISVPGGMSNAAPSPPSLSRSSSVTAPSPSLLPLQLGPPTMPVAPLVAVRTSFLADALPLHNPLGPSPNRVKKSVSFILPSGGQPANGEKQSKHMVKRSSSVGGINGVRNGSSGSPKRASSLKPALVRSPSSRQDSPPKPLAVHIPDSNGLLQSAAAALASSASLPSTDSHAAASINLAAAESSSSPPLSPTESVRSLVPLPPLQQAQEAVMELRTSLQLMRQQSPPQPLDVEGNARTGQEPGVSNVQSAGDGVETDSASEPSYRPSRSSVEYLEVVGRLRASAFGPQQVAEQGATADSARGALLAQQQQEQQQQQQQQTTQLGITRVVSSGSLPSAAASSGAAAMGAMPARRQLSFQHGYGAQIGFIANGAQAAFGSGLGAASMSVRPPALPTPSEPPQSFHPSAVQNTAMVPEPTISLSLPPPDAMMAGASGTAVPSSSTAMKVAQLVKQELLLLQLQAQQHGLRTLALTSHSPESHTSPSIASPPLSSAPLMPSGQPLTSSPPAMSPSATPNLPGPSSPPIAASAIMQAMAELRELRAASLTKGTDYAARPAGANMPSQGVGPNAGVTAQQEYRPVPGGESLRLSRGGPQSHPVHDSLERYSSGSFSFDADSSKPLPSFDDQQEEEEYARVR